MGWLDFVRWGLNRGVNLENIAKKPIEECQKYKAGSINHCDLIREYRDKKLKELKDGTSEYNLLYQRIQECARCARGK